MIRRGATRQAGSNTVAGATSKSRDTLVRFGQPEPPDDTDNQQQADDIHRDRHFRSPPGPISRSRFALLTTVSDDIAMAAPAIIGLSKIPSTM